MGQKYVTVEPNWDNLRRWVLALYLTDPERAKNIAATMGSEAPEFPTTNEKKGA